VFGDAGLGDLNRGNVIAATFTAEELGFYGSGANVTNLNASSLSSGTVGIGRLSSPLQLLSTNYALGLTNLHGTNLIAGSVSNASIAAATIASNKLAFAVATSQQLQDATNATGGIKAGAFSLGANSINSWDDVTNYFAQGLVGYNFNGADGIFTNGIVVRSNSWPAAYTLLNGDVRLVSSNGSPYLLTKDLNSTTFTYYLGQLANLWWTNPVSAASISNLYNLSIGGSAASLTFGSTSVVTNNGNQGLRQYAGVAPTGKFTEWGPSGIFVSDATNNTTFNLSGGSATNNHVFLVKTGRKIAGTADASSLSGQLDTISFLPTGGILLATNVFVEGNLSATNGFSSGGTTFTRMPTNTPANGDVITAAGTAGYTKYAAPTGGSGGPQTNLYWDVAGTLPAVEADASGPVMYFRAHDQALRWRIDDGNSQLNGSNSISLGVTGVDVNSDIKAFYADRTGATTVGVPAGVVTVQGTVNINSAPSLTVTDNGVSTVVRSNMVQALVGSFTTTTNAGNSTIQANGVQSLVTSNRVYTGTLFADTQNVATVFYTNMFSASQSNALAWFQSDGSMVGTNIVAGGVGFSGSITNGGGTVSTFVVHDANKKLIGTAASSVLLTTLTDETGTGVAVFGTAPTFTTRLTSPQVDYTTNSGSAISPNMAVSYALLSTNLPFVMLLPTGVAAGETTVQTSVLMVTNTTAAVVVITPAAAPVKSTGTWNVTNVSSITTIVYPKVVTNMICLPIF